MYNIVKSSATMWNLVDDFYNIPQHCKASYSLKCKIVQLYATAASLIFRMTAGSLFLCVQLNLDVFQKTSFDQSHNILQLYQSQP